MNTATAPRITVTCSCEVCRANAVRVGAAFPLAATVPARLAGMVGKGRTANHGLVYDAHNPDALGAAVRARLGLLPA